MRCIAICALALGAALNVAAQGVIGELTLRPTVIPIGTATTVTFTALIPSPGLLVGGANLLRVTATGQTVAVLGILHDDGLTGDAVAGDRIYSLRFALNEAAAGRIFLRSSAAFQGQLQRAQSSTIAIDVGPTAVALAINLTALPAPNPAGWNRANVTVSFQCSGGAGGAASCPGVTIVSAETTGQPVTGTARDGANNSVSKSVTVKLDKTIPALAITAPPDNSTQPSPVTVAGTVADPISGAASVTCNGATATVASGKFTCSVPLVAGVNTVQVQAKDVADNVATSSIKVTFGTGPGNPTITDYSPKSGPVGTLVTVTGTNLAPQMNTVAQVTLAKQGGGTIDAPVGGALATSLSFTIPSGAATGPFVILVNGKSVTSPALLTVTPSANFTLTAAPPAADLIRGQSASYILNLSGTLTQLAVLSVSGVPQGVTASFKPANITAGQTSILTLTAPAGQALGSRSLTLSASATVDGVALTQTAQTQLNIIAPTTSFLGRTVVDDPLQTPIAGVTVTMLGKDGSGGTTGCTGSGVSDAAGNFLLRNLAANCVGRQLVGFDGTTATAPLGKYAGVNLVYTFTAGQVTTSPMLVHLPRIDNKETFLVQQNAPVDQSYSYKSVPGLSVTVYKNTTFTMPNGSQPNPFPLAGIQVPIDRLPDSKPPVPTMLLVFIVAFQPANARASQPVAIYYPNTIQTRAGVNMPMMTLDPTRGAMGPYGTGTVSPDGTRVVPDLDPNFPGRRYGIVNFDWHGPMPPPPPPSDDPGPRPCPASPPPCENCCSRCPPAHSPMPVEYSSGIEMFTRTDLSFGGARGTVSLVRQYRTLSRNNGPFGIGGNHNYGYSLDSLNPQSATLINLITPEWSRVPFRRAGNVLVNDTLFEAASMFTDPSGRVTIRFKDGTVWSFTLPGAAFPLLESITDRNGNAITLTRDPARPARITEITDPVGRKLILDYDAQDRIVSAVDPIGRAVGYTYNGGALATVIDAENLITKYDYVAPDRLERETNPRDVVVMENTYDGNGRIIQQKLGDGGIYLMNYTLLNPTVGNSPVIQTVVTDPLDRTTIYRFNPEQHLTDVTDPTGQSRIWERKAGSNLVTAIKGTGGCVTCGTAGAGDVSFVYDDATGNLRSQTDALGRTTQYTYESTFNKLEMITDALGNVTRFTYDSRGNLASLTDANRRITTYTYDQFGQLIETVDPLKQKTKFAYDAFGNLNFITDALKGETRFRYDGISRQTEVLDPLGRRSLTDYDKLSRMTRQVDPKGGVTQFAYDRASNLVLATDARGKQTKFTFDGVNRLLTRTTPLNKTDFRTYDFNGNLIRFVDRRGQASTFTYDTQDQLATESYQDSTVKRFYDATGHLVRVEDSAAGVFTNAYDLTGQLLLAAGPFGAVKCQRDELGRVKSRQVVGQPAVGYTYDPVGNLLNASMPQASASFTYNERNQLLTSNRANGVSSQYVYDPVGQLLSITHARGAAPLSALAYTNNAAGERTSLQSNIAQGLITQPAQSTFDDGNRLLQRGTTVYSHDDNGNLLTETGAGGAIKYAWDSRNRLSMISKSNGQTTMFFYDFAGNLLQQRDTGPTLTLSQTYVLDDLTNVAHVSRSDGNQYSVLAGRAIDEHFATADSSGQIEYGLPDGVNSTIATTDQAGAIKGSIRYDPFGQTTAIGTIYPFAYTGRILVSSDLYYYRARFYNSQTGRFISEDPVRAGALNLYSYAANNPIRNYDPLGLAAVPVEIPFPIVMPMPPGDPGGPPGGPPPGSNGPRLPMECLVPDECEVYRTEGRPDLYAICRAAGEGPWRNCVRRCLQTNFFDGRYGEPYGFFGPDTHARCFVRCAIFQNSC